MKRWIKRILLSLIVLVLILTGGFYIYFFLFSGLENAVDNQINALVKPEYNFDVSFDKISGDFFSGIEITGISASYVDSNISYVFAQIPRLKLNYSLDNLWNRNYIFDLVKLDSAILTIRKDSLDRTLLPNFKSSDPNAAKRTIPAFAVEQLEAQGLELSIISRNDSTVLKNVTFGVAIRAEEETYALSVKELEFSSNKERFLLESTGGNVTYANDALLIQGLSLVSRNVRIKLEGNVSLAKDRIGAVDFSIDNLDLAEVTKYFGVNLKGVVDLNGSVTFDGDKIAGRADIAGNFMIASFRNLFFDFEFENKVLTLDTLYGTILENCSVDGYGVVDFSQKPEQYELYADIKNFNLTELVTGTFESDLSGNIALRGESFSNKDLILRVQTELWESTFDEYPIQQANGEIVITTDSMIFKDGFNVSYYENEFDVSGKVEYSDDMYLDIRARLDNLERYRGKFFIDKPAGRAKAEATLSGKTSDPDLKGIFYSDSLWLYEISCDSFYSTFDIDRFLTGRRGEVESQFFAGEIWSLPYDSSYVKVSLDSTDAYLDSISVLSPTSVMSAGGLFDFGSQPQKLEVDSLELNVFGYDFSNRGSLVFEVDSTGIEMIRPTIGSNGTRISAEGRMNFDETINLTFNVNRAQLGPWIALFEKEWEIDGMISGRTDLTGSMARPNWQLLSTIDSLTYRGLVLGDLATSVSYDNRLLTIDSLLINANPGRYFAHGSIYVDLSLTSDSLERFPDLPMDVMITATDNRFDLVSLVMPSVEQLEGDFNAEFRLTGSPLDPHLEGGGGIRNADLKYFDLKDHIKADSAIVSLEDNRILVDDIEIYSDSRGKRRYAYLDGEIIVKSFDNFYYDLDVRLPKEFPFDYELDDIRGVVEGELHVEGDTPPLVTGDLAFISARYEVNFAEADEGSPIMIALQGEDAWDLNLNIEVLSNYWIKNDDIDAEFSGDLNLIRQAGQYRFLGEMEIRRGRGFLFDKTFQIEPGSKVNYEGNLNPRLDITAYTWVTTSSEGLIGQEEKTYDKLKVGLHITGTLENPEFYPSEDSDIQNREDIFPLIVANYYSSDQGSASGSFGRRVTGLISSQASQIGSRQLGRIGVETFEIDPTYEGQIDLARTKVTVGGRPLSSNLYLYGQVSGESGKEIQEIGFEYRFIRNVILEGRKDEDDLYQLLLKLFWEFR